MAEHLRFAALAAALFVLAYGGVAWALAGAPLPALSTAWLKPEPDVRPAALSVPREPIAVSRERIRGPLVPDNGARQNDGFPFRDKLRLEAYQAGKDYALAPCDKTAKARLIEAVSAYVQAWHDMMGCGPGGCDQDKLNAAAEAFSTPLDMKVREAIGAAFDKRGITVDDFPPPLRINVAMLARGPGDPSSICGTPRAEAVR
ncbi:MAG: hypothetical protein WD039_09880 [Xanthobacteraceae bacterium]